MKLLRSPKPGECLRLPPFCSLGTSLETTLALMFLLTGALAMAAAGPAHPQREILDSCLGSRWQFHVDPAHPERPAQLVLIDRSALPPSQTQPAPVIAIRAGDRITVEQETAFLHARLQAVAIESAIAGQVLRVRLASGKSTLLATGAVIRIRAIAPGQGRWLTAEQRSQ